MREEVSLPSAGRLAQAPGAAQASGSGGCGCGGSNNGSAQAAVTEQAAAQGVMQAFGQMLGGPEARLTREDLSAAFNTPLHEVRCARCWLAP